jgi:hypothetical protein
MKNVWQKIVIRENMKYKVLAKLPEESLREALYIKQYFVNPSVKIGK